jgi:hypothetical protein
MMNKPIEITRETRVLTIRQPYAWAICNLKANPKRVENRTWRPPESLFGQVILVHAGKTFEIDGLRHIKDISEIAPPAPREFTTGAIVGGFILSSFFVANSGLNGNVPRCQGVWATGPVCWLMESAFSFPEPIPFTGRLGLQNLTACECDECGECSSYQNIKSQAKDLVLF